MASYSCRTFSAIMKDTLKLQKQASFARIESKIHPIISESLQMTNGIVIIIKQTLLKTKSTAITPPQYFLKFYPTFFKCSHFPNVLIDSFFQYWEKKCRKTMKFASFRYNFTKVPYRWRNMNLCHHGIHHGTTILVNTRKKRLAVLGQLI